MRRYFIMSTILGLCLVLPGTVFHYWSWAGIKPDLSMLWVIYIALHHRPLQGAVYGFGTGLIVDLYFGRYIGMYTVTLTAVALLSSLLQQRWYRENILLTTVLVFLVTVLGQSVIAFLATVAGLNWYFGDIIRVILGVSLYNALLVPITYPLVHRSFTGGLLRQPSKYEQQ